MIIKNIQNMISECINYADEINQSGDYYPADAKMPLKDYLRYDMIVFLGYLYDPENEVLEDQINFIKTNLHMILVEDKFLELIEKKCQDEDFFEKIPNSLSFFIKYDQDHNSIENRLSIAKSKYVADSFRKLGEGFISYENVNPAIKARLAKYVEVMNNALVESGVVPAESQFGKKANSSLAQEDEKAKKSVIENGRKKGTVTTYDEKTGRYTTKKAVSIDGYSIVKKRADDVSEFANFQSEEEAKPGLARGKSKIGGNRRGDESDEIEKGLDELIQDLRNLIGLDTVKEDVIHLINIIKVRKLREMRGLRRVEMSFHLVFTGNPGTGKTTVARLLAKIYKQLGLVSKGQLVEVDRSALVDHFSGGTAIKTTQVIDKAIGGILFIDEAYTLTYNKDSGDYGQEAVDTLLKRMEDDRDDFIVIVAGYPHEMTEFIESNPGLKSRFNKYIHFTDYSSGELMEIFEHLCRETDYVLTESAATMARSFLTGIAEGKKDNFANARLVRNYFERCVDRQSNRIVKDENINDDDLVTFIREDMIDDVEKGISGMLEKTE